jgi:hypothetical protein
MVSIYFVHEYEPTNGHVTAQNISDITFERFNSFGTEANAKFHELQPRVRIQFYCGSSEPQEEYWPVSTEKEFRFAMQRWKVVQDKCIEDTSCSMNYNEPDCFDILCLPSSGECHFTHFV